MRGGVAILRPEPGNARTAERAAERGLIVLRLPLFAIRPLAWEIPDTAAFDALLLTSAAAVRHAGAGLDACRGLPVVAVGIETATAARDAGLDVVITGSRGAAAALELARARGLARLLHLAGHDRMPSGAGVHALAVYASAPLPIPPGATGPLADGEWTALLHSARAARWFADLVDRDGTPRVAIAVAALSPAVLAAAGAGWRRAAAATAPRDNALLDLVLSWVPSPDRVD